MVPDAFAAVNFELRLQPMPPDRDHPERHHDRCQGREDEDSIGAANAAPQQIRIGRPKRKPGGCHAPKTCEGELQPSGFQIGNRRSGLRAPLVGQQLRSWVTSCHTNGSERRQTKLDNWTPVLRDAPRPGSPRLTGRSDVSPGELTSRGPRGLYMPSRDNEARSQPLKQPDSSSKSYCITQSKGMHSH